MVSGPESSPRPSGPESSPRPSAGAPPGIPDGGRGHRVENALAVLALGLGLLAMACLALRSWDAGAGLGLGAGLVATYDELLAETSGERRLILAGFLLAVVAVAVSMANGGLFGA